MIVFNDPIFAAMVVHAANVADFNPLRDPSISNVVGGKLLGGVVFQDCTGPGGSIVVHFAGLLPGWINRAMLWNTFHFAFNTVGVKKVIGKVHENNYKSIKLCLHLGLQIETAIKDVYPNGDALIMSMYRDDCKWLDIPKPNVIVVDGTPNGLV